MRRIYALFGMGLVLAAFFWLGLSAFIGARAGQQMEKVLGAPAGSGLRSTVTPLRQDILGSSFVQDLEIDTGPLSLLAPAPTVLRLRLRHELAPGPVLFTGNGPRVGLAFIRTTLDTGDAGATDLLALSSLVERPELLGDARLDTSLDFAGQSSSHIFLPEGLVLRAAGAKPEGAAARLGRMTGWLARDAAGGVWFDLFMDRLKVQAPGLEVESQGLRWFGGAWTNALERHEGYFVQRVSKTRSLLADSGGGPGLASSSLDDDTAYALGFGDDGYALRVNRGISRLELASVALTEVKCRLLVSRIDPVLVRECAKALEQLAKRHTGQGDAKDTDRGRLAAELARTAGTLLAAKPPRLDIQEVSALNPGGLAAVSGALWLEPSARDLAGPRELAAGTRAWAQVAVNRRFVGHLGDLAVFSPALEHLLALGLASERQDVIESRLDYDGRMLSLNGKPLSGLP